MARTNVRVNVAEVEAREAEYGYNYRNLTMAIRDEYNKCHNRDVQSILLKVMDTYREELYKIGYYD